MPSAWRTALVLAVAGTVAAFQMPPSPLRTTVVVRSDRQVEAVTSDDPLVRKLEAEVAALSGGAGLDALLNPAKLINVERELIDLRARADAGDDSADLAAEIEKKEGVAYVEKRAVMRDWLKTLFRGQAYATVGLSFLLSNDWIPFVHLDLSIRVLGFWSWWLFTVPSLRSIKPLPPAEKKALDAAFLLTLVASVAGPFATKDPAAIWWIDAAVVGACYAYGYLAPEDDAAEIEEDDVFDAKAGAGGGAFGQQLWRSAKWAGRALDFGAGRERGARTDEASAVEKALESTIQSKAAADDEAGVEAPLDVDKDDDYGGIPP